MRQMNDLHVEIKSNIDLVQEKKRVQAKDTNQFIRVLCEDVRQFIACMHDDLAQVYQAIEERDIKCKDDIKEVEGTVLVNEGIKQDLTKASTQLGTNERKELAKVEAMREHAVAMKRHMENTSSYLKKEVKAVEIKIEEAKDLMFKNIGVKIDEYETILDQEEAKNIIEREIIEDEAEEEEEDERDMTLIVPHQSHPLIITQQPNIHIRSSINTSSLRSSKQSLEYKQEKITYRDATGKHIEIFEEDYDDDSRNSATSSDAGALRTSQNDQPGNLIKRDYHSEAIRTPSEQMIPRKQQSTSSKPVDGVENEVFTSRTLAQKQM